MSLSLVLSATLLVGAVGYLVLAGYVWRYRSVAGARPLVVLLLAIGVWTLCYCMELRSHDVASAQLWSGLKYLGVVAAAPAMLAFVAEYTGRGRGLPVWVLAALAVEPLIVLVMLTVPATRDLIHYYPTDPARMRFVGAAPVNLAGPLFWPHAVYNYALLLVAIGTFVIRASRVAQPYQRQAWILIGVTLLPVIGNMLYAFDVTGVAVDPTPFLFTLTAVVLVWGFIRLRLLDVMPVARGVIVERMADAVLVVDAYGRVLDLNPAAAALLGHTRRELIGHQVAEVAPALMPAGEDHDQPAEQWECRLGADRGVDSGVDSGVDRAPPRDVAVSVTRLTDPRGRETAHLLVLRDITDLKRTERQLRTLLVEKTELSDTLRAGLRPRSLPAVPGLAIAVRSLPADRQDQVSGDFYDVHPAGPGRWAVVLGDVSGRGVEAAVVTSMARYTLRMLSRQGWRPSQVLGQLNQALLAADDTDRFCTVVYGLIEPSEVGTRVTLALGGHPAPLLLRRDGTVTPVGVAGTALGLLPEVEHQDTTIDLHPGEVLLAFTDGVVEAHRGREQFGEERLAGVLADAASARWSRMAYLADVLAGRVIEAVEGFGADPDDVAVLVLVAEPAPLGMASGRLAPERACAEGHSHGNQGEREGQAPERGGGGDVAPEEGAHPVHHVLDRVDFGHVLQPRRGDAHRQQDP